VYDYEGGKLDWLGAGLPREGDDAGKLTVGEVARGWPQAVVVDEAGVVLGRLRRSRLQEAPTDLVDDLMEEGPSTARANEDLAGTVKGMVDDGIHFLLVSTPEGFPLGLLFLQDATERLARDQPAAGV